MRAADPRAAGVLVAALAGYPPAPGEPDERAALPTTLAAGELSSCALAAYRRLITPRSR